MISLHEFGASCAGTRPCAVESSPTNSCRGNLSSAWSVSTYTPTQPLGGLVTQPQRSRSSSTNSGGMKNWARTEPISLSVMSEPIPYGLGPTSSSISSTSEEAGARDGPTSNIDALVGESIALVLRLKEKGGRRRKTL